MASANDLATFKIPSKLKTLAATSVIQLLIYEDYNECNFYRWDPVSIWQYETHQPKKKKGVQKDMSVFGHPPPPWKGIQNFHKWWLKEASYLIGTALDSPLRVLIIEALERQSWTSYSEEEDLLFMLVRLCIDTVLHFSSKFLNEHWYNDAIQIIEGLGPFPLQKVIIESDVFEGNSRIPCTIIQNSPHLQILRISQWELSNDILFLLPTHCPLLQEFSIYDMEPDVYMNEDAFFKCFFLGKSKAEVTSIFSTHHSKPLILNSNDDISVVPPLSFPALKYVDILFCIHTETLIAMLAYFYPNITFSTFSISHLDSLRKSLESSYIRFPFVRLYCSALDLKNDYSACHQFVPFPKQLRIDIDKSYPGVETRDTLDKLLEEASEKLKTIMIESPSIDSLALRPHQDVCMTKLVLPTFGSSGASLKSLYFVYDIAPVCSNVLYQLLNLCPLLETLIIELKADALDVSSQSFRTELRELEFLESLVFLEVKKDNVEDTPDGEINNGESNRFPEAYYSLLRDLLSRAPKLKNLSIPFSNEDIHMTNFDDGKVERCNNSALSKSVQRLHLNLSNDCYSYNISAFLFRFPSLKWLSLCSDAKKLWAEMLDSVSHRGIDVTKKKFEFTNVFRWDDKRHNFIYNSKSEDFVQFWC